MADDVQSLPATPLDRDHFIRTVIGEAGPDHSALAVAHVIANRMRQSGAPAYDVVHAPNQFEAWDRQNLTKYKPSDPAYQRAATIVDSVLSGKSTDPTQGATQFYAPTAQAALGRKPPKWGTGQGTNIGAQKFVGGAGDVDPFEDVQSAQKSAPSRAPVAAAPSADVDPFEDVGLKATETPAVTAATPSAARTKIPESFAPIPKNWTPKPASAQGAMGLVWDESGGRDPQTGELIVPGPERDVNAPQHGQLIAGAGGVLSGVPIAGPALLSGAQKGAAAINTLQTNTPYQENLAQARNITEAATSAYPKTALAGNVGGALVGTIPAMAAAPGLFGLGGGGLIPQALTSGVSGATINAIDAAVRSGNYSPALGSPMATGAMTGGAFGLAAPFAGHLIGQGVESLSNLLSRTTPEARNVSNVLAEIGMTPADARARLTSMGPNATLADIDPALTTEAGGLARLGGAPTSILKGAMAQRASGADDRVATAVEQSLGPRPDVTAAKDAVYETAQNFASPHYTAARAMGGSMDVAPIVSDITAQLKSGAVGGEAAVLNKAKSFLTQDTATVPGPNGKPMTMSILKDDPGALLKTRQEMDGIIESLKRNGTIDGTSAGKNAFRAANDIRGQLDDILKQNPHIAAGDQAFSEQMRLKDAIDEGSQIFTKGTKLPDFQRSLAAKSPEEVSALRQGALSSIWEALDNARRGTLSGAQSMFSKSSANRAKLDALFPNAGDVFDMIHGEAAMRATEQRVAQNSVTAEAQAVGKKYSPQTEAGIGAAAPILGAAIGGGEGAAALTTGRILYGSLKDQLTRNALARLSEGTARGLAATGPAQQQFLGQLSRAYATNALSRGASETSGALANLLTRVAGPQGYNALSAR